MEALIRLAKDKTTMDAIRLFMNEKMKEKIISKVIKKEDISGYADASEVIKTALNEIEALGKEKKEPKNINQSE